MTITHLSDDKMTEVLCGLASPAEAEHLRACPQCSAAAEYLAATIAGMRDGIVAASEQPPAFWLAQRDAIWQRTAPRRSPVLALAWAANFALLVLAVLLLFNTPPPQPQVSSIDPDDALLLSVSSALQSDSPRALKAATLIAAELQQHVPATATPASQD